MKTLVGALAACDNGVHCPKMYHLIEGLKAVKINSFLKIKPYMILCISVLGLSLRRLKKSHSSDSNLTAQQQ